MNNLLTLPKRGSYKSMFNVEAAGILCCAIACALSMGYNAVSVFADGFTDIFYSSSFRGSVQWFSYFGWLGTVVQIVISVFSLVGVSLIIIRIMTSLLYLSARGLWEEVHELKNGASGDKYDLGMGNLLKSWGQGKAGTGIDAILGAVLVLLPDVIKYSDFSDKAGGKEKMDKDITVTQYIMKIAIPTIMSVFFFAMGFNGTLVEGLAVTVDAMGSLADQAVSVNYSGFVDDLVAKGTGYKFKYSMEGTKEGKLKNQIAKNIYAKVVSTIDGVNVAQQSEIGTKIEIFVDAYFDSLIAQSTGINVELQEKLKGETPADGSAAVVDDYYYGFLGFDVYMNTTSGSATVTDLPTPGDGGVVSPTEAPGPLTSIDVTKFYPSSNVETPEQSYFVHVSIKQSKTYNGGGRATGNAFGS